jgi:hypothetical protein
MLFHVYADPKPEGYFEPTTEPFGIYRQILDADWLLWILLPLLLVIIVALLMLAWRVHEIPAHKADHKKMRQMELVSALTLLGLFQHWVWAIALFIAYMDWQAMEDWFVNILRRSHQPAAAVPPAPTFSQSATAPSAPLEPTLTATPTPPAREEPKA